MGDARVRRNSAPHATTQRCGYRMRRSGLRLGRGCGLLSIADRPPNPPALRPAAPPSNQTLQHPPQRPPLTSFFRVARSLEAVAARSFCLAIERGRLLILR
eukprot:scaffold66164_cov66-Phaeocystis_antarctica.AAC.3